MLAGAGAILRVAPAAGCAIRASVPVDVGVVRGAVFASAQSSVAPWLFLPVRVAASHQTFFAAHFFRRGAYFSNARSARAIPASVRASFAASAPVVPDRFAQAGRSAVRIEPKPRKRRAGVRTEIIPRFLRTSLPCQCSLRALLLFAGADLRSGAALAETSPWAKLCIS